MEELVLKRISLAVTVLGLLGLWMIVSLSEPQEISSAVLPQDELVSYQGTVVSVNGNRITVERVVEEVLYLDENVSGEVVGRRVEVVGMQSGEFFEVKRIE